uniref:Uncharacterized protein n=1 Tax=Cacopsylla melanoneura TaxID=428564 RepID=A0A8D8ZZD1_9HEMI
MLLKSIELSFTSKSFGILSDLLANTFNSSGSSDSVLFLTNSLDNDFLRNTTSFILADSFFNSSGSNDFCLKGRGDCSCPSDQSLVKDLRLSCTIDISSSSTFFSMSEPSGVMDSCLSSESLEDTSEYLFRQGVSFFRHCVFFSLLRHGSKLSILSQESE